MSEALLIEDNRARTRRLLLRSLHKADARQQKVARRRVALRSFVRVAKVGSLVALLSGLAIWIVQAMGLMPAIEVRIVESAPAKPVAIVEAPLHQKAANLPAAPIIESTPEIVNEPVSEADALSLKLDHQANSLNP